MVNFPAPIGGTSLPPDFGPSILFAVLYGLLVPLMAYRMFDRRSRSALLIGTISFSIERVVIFSLRAVQAHNESKRYSKGLATYMQISFGLGFIGIANDLVNLIRCLLVNATYGSERYSESPAASSKGGLLSPPPEGTPDLPRVRFWARRFTDLLGPAFLAATVPGIIANSHYSKVFDDQNQADKTAKNRIISSAIALALTVLCISVALWGKVKLPRMHKRPVLVLGQLCILLSIIPIYRLSVMHYRIDVLRGPDPLNSSSAKALFYIFHVLPEWLAICVLISENVRKTFGTGLFGDWRGKDETETEKTKRLAKRAAKEEKKKGISMEKLKQGDIGEKGKKENGLVVTQESV
ncbi:hypothetical protein M413DRAFT_442117 [Hebeloma cylindrosporum]|uniref:Uncharacterized protein n=1 Tax=Hebeloma cylindrosporum TaxID=76867 RepID=A0A0C2Y6E5_HEBCY|nr:hypothetical protein M413DRAFT_442117 [Hebeloma cylindrosporum h7]